MVIEIGVRPGDMVRGVQRVDGAMRRGGCFILFGSRAVVVLLTVSTSSSSHLIQHCTSGFVNVKGLA